MKNKETGQYETDFINFVCFEKKAIYLNDYAKKGDKIELTGKLRVDNWKDDEGNYHTKTYVVADTVKILSNKPKQEEKDIFDDPTSFEITDDDLPF